MSMFAFILLPCSFYNEKGKRETIIREIDFKVLIRTDSIISIY